MVMGRQFFSGIAGLRQWEWVGKLCKSMGTVAVDNMTQEWEATLQHRYKGSREEEKCVESLLRHIAFFWMAFSAFSPLLKETVPKHDNNRLLSKDQIRLLQKVQ